MPAEPPIDPAVFDAVQFGIVQRLLSPERLNAHLRDLDQQLLAIAGSPGPSLRDQAHKIISQAGMFGLMRLSGCMRALEDACRDGEGKAGALVRFREAAQDVRLYAMPAAGAAAG